MISSSHTECCKRCGHNTLNNIDDYVEVCDLNERNRETILRLEDLLHQVKESVKHYDKCWDDIWGSEKDMDFYLPCEYDMKDYSLYLED